MRENQKFLPPLTTNRKLNPVFLLLLNAARDISFLYTIRMCDTIFIVVLWYKLFRIYINMWGKKVQSKVCYDIDIRFLSATRLSVHRKMSQFTWASNLYPEIHHRHICVNLFFRKTGKDYWSRRYLASEFRPTHCWRSSFFARVLHITYYPKIRIHLWYVSYRNDMSNTQISGR